MCIASKPKIPAQKIPARPLPAPEQEPVKLETRDEGRNSQDYRRRGTSSLKIPLLTSPALRGGSGLNIPRS